jgi:hypothetical protein
MKECFLVVTSSFFFVSGATKGIGRERAAVAATFVLAQDSSRKLGRIIHKYVHTFTVSSFHSVGRLFWTHLNYMDPDSWVGRACYFSRFSLSLFYILVSSRLLFESRRTTTTTTTTTLLPCFVIDRYKNRRPKDFPGNFFCFQESVSRVLFPC